MAIVFTKAVMRASERLGISQKALASIIGLSEATISRMRKGSFALESDDGKPFEVAQLFLQLYDLLDRMVMSDELAARAWLATENSALGGRRPIELIQSLHGIAEVVGYLRARSSL